MELIRRSSSAGSTRRAETSCSLDRVGILAESAAKTSFLCFNAKVHIGMGTRGAKITRPGKGARETIAASDQAGTETPSSTPSTKSATICIKTETGWLPHIQRGIMTSMSQCTMNICGRFQSQKKMAVLCSPSTTSAKSLTTVSMDF